MEKYALHNNIYLGKIHLESHITRGSVDSKLGISLNLWGLNVVNGASSLSHYNGPRYILYRYWQINLTLKLNQL